MQEKRVHQVFVISIAAKGAHAFIEVVGGLVLYLTSSRTLTRWTHSYAWASQHFHPPLQHFYAFYLLSHGIVKAVLVFFLLREKLWAYPAAIAVFGVFILYQVYRYSFTHDVALLLLSIFDLFVIYLAFHEYRLLRKRLAND